MFALNQRSLAEEKSKGQKSIAQGNTLGGFNQRCSPCKGKSP